MEHAGSYALFSLCFESAVYRMNKDKGVELAAAGQVKQNWNKIL